MKILFFGHLTNFIVFFGRKSLEQGNLVLKSGVLDKALSKIQTHGNQVSGLEFKPYHEGIYTIVVFAAPSCRLDSAASTLMSGSEDQNPFHFLCSEKNPSFPLHTPAYQLFDSVRKDLIHLRSEVNSQSNSASLWLFFNKPTTLYSIHFFE